MPYRPYNRSTNAKMGINQRDEPASIGERSATQRRTAQRSSAQHNAVQRGLAVGQGSSGCGAGGQWHEGPSSRSGSAVQARQNLAEWLFRWATSRYHTTQVPKLAAGGQAKRNWAGQPEHRNTSPATPGGPRASGPRRRAVRPRAQLAQRHRRRFRHLAAGAAAGAQAQHEPGKGHPATAASCTHSSNRVCALSTGLARTRPRRDVPLAPGPPLACATGPCGRPLLHCFVTCRGWRPRPPGAGQGAHGCPGDAVCRGGARAAAGVGQPYRGRRGGGGRGAAG